MASAYEAIIKIGVQGQQELDRALNKVEQLNKAIGGASAGDRTVQSLQAYNAVLKETARNLRFVELGTKAETIAIKQYVDALGQSNTARERQSKLIADQVRQQRLAASGIRETPNQYARPAGPAGNAANLAAGTFRAGENKLKAATGAMQEILEQNAIKGLKQVEEAAIAGIAADNKVFAVRKAQEDKYWKGRMAQADVASKREQSQAALTTKARTDRSKSIKGAIGSSLIGGGFPLLFGQGAGAGIGGAAGGLLGPALLGGAGGFAGGIVGSLIGTQFDKVKQSAIGMAEALREPSKLLEAMATAGITTSSALKNTVAALEGMGRGAEAQALVFAELEKLGGTDYVQNLLELEEANKELQAAWSEMSVEIQKRLLPYFIELTNAATELAKSLEPVLDVLGKMGPVLDALLTAAVPFGLGSLIKNGGNVVAGPGGAKKEDSKIRTPQLGDTEQRKAIDEAVARQKEIVDLQRQGASLIRDAEDFRRDQEEAINGFRKRAADYDKEIAEFRKGLEDKIFDKRQQVLRAESDLLRKQAQLSIERSDLSLAAAGRIPSEQGGGRSQLVDIAREYLRTRAEGEADLQQKEQQSKLDIASIQRETTKFEQDVNKKIVDLRQKSDDYKRDVEKFSYDTAKKIYDYQIKAADYQYAMWKQGYAMAITAAEKIGAAANGVNPYGNVSAPAGAVGVGGGSFQMSRMDFIKWMRTQGFERTSGDFTNRGHATPNHMLNAIDMGILGGSDSAALRRTAAMEQRLAATGSLGTQLFGPTRDPYGHGMGRGGQNIHLHIPSPGGMVNINPALAEVMKLGRTPAKGGAAALAPAAAAMPNLGAMPNAPTIAPIGAAPRMGAVPNFNAETEKFNELQQRSIDLAERSLTVERELAKTRMDAAQAGLEESTAATLQQFLQPMLDANQQLKDRAAYEREYGDLLSDGTLPALAEQLASVSALEKTQLRLLEIEETAVNAAVAKSKALIESNTLKGEELELEKEKLKILEKQQAAIPGTRTQIEDTADQNRGLAEQAESPEARRQKALNQYNTRKNERDSETRPFEKYMEAKADLEDLVDPLNQVISATNALGSAFGDAFQGIISGSESADEALKKMFTNLASYFLNMAAQILAQQALTSILGLISGGAGSALGGAFGSTGASTNPSILSSVIGAAFGGARAEGGPVSSGSAYLVGENGPELFLPGSSGAIVPNGQSPAPLKPADQYGMGGQELPEVTYSGAVLRFNEQDYVAKGDVPKIIKASVAATGREMRNSVGYRNRAGIR